MAHDFVALFPARSRHTEAVGIFSNRCRPRRVILFGQIDRLIEQRARYGRREAIAALRRDSIVKNCGSVTPKSGPARALSVPMESERDSSLLF
jgi:hypothetical protein